jgi:NADH-quinone oxidoreductase subunit L
MGNQMVGLILVFPLIGFILLVAFNHQFRRAAGLLGTVLVALSFVLSISLFFQRLDSPADETLLSFPWLMLNGHAVNLGIEINQLNTLMLVVVTAVSLLVHIYSMGYMNGDERYAVFYAYLSLFTFSMLGVVVAPNLLQLYIFWELVGVASFLLIGFWYFKPEAKAAARKAFIVTRLGDIGLFIAIALIFWKVGAFDYYLIFNAVEDGTLNGGFLTLVAILIFVGAVGKSGQFPLHTWLPDAMEGPTPVSALIHAATMVAAGVYLVARLNPLYQASPTALETVAVIGGFTAIFAASIGLVQNDIKRVLAYSTVSQLGYMMLALGSAGYAAGVFHLTTHAFFKALLFLAAGSVIHAVGTQDIHAMGGLWKRMRVTAWTFLIGALALSGIFPLSGFFSKDAILLAAYQSGHTVLFWLGVIAAFFTAFYMFRLFFLCFGGVPKSGHEAHESPAVMTVPLIVLALAAIAVGWLNTPWYHGFTRFLGTEAGEHGAGWIMFVSLSVSLAGILLAWLIYSRQVISRDWLSRRFYGLYALLFNKYYMDEFYHYIIVLPIRGLGRLLLGIDRYVIGGLVGLVAWLIGAVGRVASTIQNGQVQRYGLVTLLGLVILIVSLAVGRVNG